MPPGSPVAGRRRGRTVLCLVATVMVSLPLVVATSPAHAAGTPNTWENVPDLNEPRLWPAAATGPDDKVYVAGGQVDGTATATVEAYDPAQSKWTPTGEGALAAMIMPRAKHALVTNGQRLFAIGGELTTSFPAVSSTVEAYNPFEDTWELVAPLSVPRSGAAAVSAPCPLLIAAACVYAIGGGTNTVEVYNPATRVWAPVAPMAKARSNFGAAVGSDRRIYAVGNGTTGTSHITSELTSVEVYDPAHPELGWVAVDAVPQSREGVVRAVADRAGRIYVMGGFKPLSGVRSVDVYDPATNKWTSGPPAGGSTWPAAMETDRVVGVAATLAPDGRIFVLGGENLQGTVLSEVDAYTPPQFQPLTPARILDTRTTAKVPANTEHILAVTDVGGVPEDPTAVEAVVLRIANNAPEALGNLIVWPSGEPMPTASSLNWEAGENDSNTVIAKVGTDGNVKLFNSSPGATHFIADLVGWFPTGSDYNPLTPGRILDTRTTAKVPADTEHILDVTGPGGVPADVAKVEAVVLRIANNAPEALGNLVVWPSGDRPNASSLNWQAGENDSNTVIAKVGTDGNVKLFNSSPGATHFIADVVGWFPTGSTYDPLTPARILDTRDPPPEPPVKVGANAERTLDVTGVGEVPADPTEVEAVVLRIANNASEARGNLIVWPSDEPMPTASSLNWEAGENDSITVIAKVGTDGNVKLFNNSGGATHFIADVVGWFPT